jgi:hypothetical protein
LSAVTAAAVTNIPARTWALTDASVRMFDLNVSVVEADSVAVVARLMVMV